MNGYHCGKFYEPKAGLHSQNTGIREHFFVSDGMASLELKTRICGDLWVEYVYISGDEIQDESLS